MKHLASSSSASLPPAPISYTTEGPWRVTSACLIVVMVAANRLLEVLLVRKLRALCLFQVLVSVALFFGCSRDPNVRKHKYFDSGRRYFAQGKFVEAGIEFHNALAVDPAYADAHYQLARVLLNQQQWLPAGQELGSTLQLQPGNYSARLDLAKLLIASGDLQPAKQQVDWLLQNRPADAESHSAAADLFAAGNNFPSALQEAS